MGASLFRLKPKNTQKRAPGPGPIRRRDWKPTADKVLKNRQVILHTDGARAYKMHIPGVARYNVIHKKKKILQGGKYIWVKPHYTKVYKHKLPCGKSVQVKSGTQIIDRFWQHLRAYPKYASNGHTAITKGIQKYLISEKKCEKNVVPKMDLI